MRSSSRPSNTGNPLTSASRLCCGHKSVCVLGRCSSCVPVPESESLFRAAGAYSNADPPGLRSQRTHTGTVEQTQAQPVSQAALPSHWSSFYPLTSPLSVELWPLNSDPAGEAEPFLKAPCKKKKRALSDLCTLWPIVNGGISIFIVYRLI